MSAISKLANPDLRNNGRKKLLLFGVTGSGKSALCNALSQPVKKDDGPLNQRFPESANQQIGNTRTILKNVNFLHLRSKEISLIDTVGFNSTEMSNTAIAELIVSLKESCDYIHLFAIVVSSPKRIEASLKETIDLFVGMFGKTRFWQNTVLIFTNLQQSDDQITRRSKTRSDKEMVENFNRALGETYSLKVDVPTLIIDAHYDGSKLDERSRFKSSACELYNMLVNSGGTSVRHVQRVVGKYEGLQDEVNRLTVQAEKDRLVAEEALRQVEEERKAKEEAMKQAETERKAKEEARLQAVRERRAKEKAIRRADKERRALFFTYILLQSMKKSRKR